MAGNRKDYHNIETEYIRRFCLKHDVTFGGWIGEVGSVVIIDGLTLPFSFIVYDLDRIKSEEMFKNWKKFGRTKDYIEFCQENKENGTT